MARGAVAERLALDGSEDDGILGAGGPNLPSNGEEAPDDLRQDPAEPQNQPSLPTDSAEEPFLQNVSTHWFAPD